MSTILRRPSSVAATVRRMALAVRLGVVALAAVVTLVAAGPAQAALPPQAVGRQSRHRPLSAMIRPPAPAAEHPAARLSALLHPEVEHLFAFDGGR